MRFLPYEEFNIQTILDSNEVFYRLRYAVQPQETSGIFAFSATKKYYGKVTRNSFKISRVIRYRNSFRPVILGQISRDVLGSQVHFIMRLDWFVFIFWVLWLGCVVLIGSGWCSDLIISAIQSQTQVRLTSWELIPVGMFTFGYLLALIGFKIEAAISKKFLLDLLRGQSTNDDLLFEEKWLGLSEAQLVSLALLAFVAIAVVYFVIQLLT